MKLSRQEVMSLSFEERLEYNKRMIAERVARYRAGNQEKAREYNNEYKKNYTKRPENVEKYTAKSLEYVKKHNKTMESNRETAINTLTNAIRNKKARDEMKKLQKNKEEQKQKEQTQAPKRRGRPKKQAK